MREELQRYVSEKTEFDEKVARVKESGEADQQESEQIGFFKTNKQRLIDELKVHQEDLAKMKEELTQERINLEVARNDMKLK